MGNQFAFFVCICSAAINGEPVPQEGRIQFRWKCLPLQNTICSQTRFVLFCKIGFVLRMCCSQELAKVFWCVFPATGGIGATFKITLTLCLTRKWQTRSSWLNCALRDDEAVYWVSIGLYEAVAVGNRWYWVDREHLCHYILHKVEIWTGVTDAWLTHSLTDFER